MVKVPTPSCVACFLFQHGLAQQTACTGPGACVIFLKKKTNYMLFNGEAGCARVRLMEVRSVLGMTRSAGNAQLSG